MRTIRAFVAVVLAVTVLAGSTVALAEEPVPESPGVPVPELVEPDEDAPIIESPTADPDDLPESPAEADAGELPDFPVSTVPAGYVEGQSVEQPSERDEFGKTYLNPDGSKTHQTALVPLHWDRDGEWVDIDSNLVAEPGGFRSASNAWTAHFAALPEGVAIDTPDGTVAFSPVGANPVAAEQLSATEVIYRNAWAGADLVYRVTAEGVKEDIILNQPPTVDRFEFTTNQPFAYSDGALVPSEEGSGQVAAAEVLRADGTPVSGAGASVSAVSWTKVAPRLVVRFDQAYIASLPAEDYPIAIDPAWVKGGINMVNYKRDGFIGCNPCGPHVRFGNSNEPQYLNYWRTVGYFDYKVADDQYVTQALIYLNDQEFGTANGSNFSVYYATSMSWAGAAPVGASPIGSGPVSTAALIDVTEAYRGWVNANSWGRYVGFKGTETPGAYTYKAFRTFQLWMTTEAGLTKPTPVSPANASSTASTTPSLVARNVDARSAYLGVHVYNGAGALVNGTWCGGASPTLVASGSTCSITPSLPNADANYTYVFFAYLPNTGDDGYSDYSDARVITVDRTGPVITNIGGYPSAPNDNTWRPWGSTWAVWDAADLSAVDAFAVAWDQIPSTIPTTPRYTGICPHTNTSNPNDWVVAVPAFPANCDIGAAGNAVDGTWYLHVRAHNSAGLWGPTVHMKFQFDRTAPAAPTQVATACASNRSTDLPTVTVQWTGATDPAPGAGLRGYTWAWNHSATTPAGMGTETGGPMATEATSPGLQDGTWYFHLRSVDKAIGLDGNSNASADQVVGPITVQNGYVTNIASAAFADRWYPRLTDQDFWAAWNANPGLPANILAEGHHSKTPAEQRQLIDCLLMRVASAEGVSLTAAQRQPGIEPLWHFIFNKPAVDEMMAPYLENEMTNAEVDALPSAEEAMAPVLAQLQTIRETLPALADMLLAPLPDALKGLLPTRGELDPYLDKIENLDDLLDVTGLTDAVVEQINRLGTELAVTRTPIEVIEDQVAAIDVDGWLPAALPTGSEALVPSLTSEYLGRVLGDVSALPIGELLDDATIVPPLAAGLLQDALDALQAAGGLDAPNLTFSLCGTNLDDETRCTDAPLAAINPFDSDGDGSVDVIAQLTVGVCDVSQVTNLDGLVALVQGLVRSDPTRGFGIPFSFCVREFPGGGPVRSHVFAAYEVPMFGAAASVGFDGRAQGLADASAAQFTVTRLNSFRDAAGSLALTTTGAPPTLDLTFNLSQLDPPANQVPDSLDARVGIDQVPNSLLVDFDAALGSTTSKNATMSFKPSSPTAVEAQLRSVQANTDDTASDATISAVINQLPATRVAATATFAGSDAEVHVSADQPVSIGHLAVIGVIAPRAPEPVTTEVSLDAYNIEAKTLDVAVDNGRTVTYRARTLLDAPATDFGPITAAATTRDAAGERFHAYAHAARLPSDATITASGTVPSGDLTRASGTLTADLSAPIPSLDASIYVRELGGDRVDLRASLAATSIPRHLRADFDGAAARVGIDARMPNVTPLTSIGQATVLAGLGGLDAPVAPLDDGTDYLALVSKGPAVSLGARVTDLSYALGDLELEGNQPGISADVLSSADRPLSILATIDSDTSSPGAITAAASLGGLPSQVHIDATIDKAARVVTAHTNSSATVGRASAMYADEPNGPSGSVSLTDLPARAEIVGGINTTTEGTATHALAHGRFTDATGAPQTVGSVEFSGSLGGPNSDGPYIRGSLTNVPSAIDLTAALADGRGQVDWVASSAIGAVAIDGRFSTDRIFNETTFFNAGIAAPGLPAEVHIEADANTMQIAATTSPTAAGPVTAYLTTNDEVTSTPGHHIVGVLRPAERRLELSLDVPGLSRVTGGTLACGAARFDGTPAGCPNQTAGQVVAGGQLDLDLGARASVLTAGLDLVFDTDFVVRTHFAMQNAPSHLRGYGGLDGALILSDAVGASTIGIDGVIGRTAALATIPGVNTGGGDYLSGLADADRTDGLFAQDGAVCNEQGSCKLGMLIRGGIPFAPRLIALDPAKRTFSIELPAGADVPRFAVDAILPNLPRFLGGALPVPLIAHVELHGLPAGLTFTGRLDESTIDGFESTELGVSYASNAPIGRLLVQANALITPDLVSDSVEIESWPVDEEGQRLHEIDWDQGVAPTTRSYETAIGKLEMANLPASPVALDENAEPAVRLRLGDDPGVQRQLGVLSTTLPGPVDRIVATLGIGTASQFADQVAAGTTTPVGETRLANVELWPLPAGTNVLRLQGATADSETTVGTCSARKKFGVPTLSAQFADNTVDAEVVLNEPLFRSTIWRRVVGEGVASTVRPTSDVVVKWADSPSRWRTHIGGTEPDGALAAEIAGHNDNPLASNRDDPYGDELRIALRVLDESGTPSLSAGQFTTFTLEASLRAELDGTFGIGCGHLELGNTLEVTGAAIEASIEPILLRRLAVDIQGARSMTLLLPHLTTMQMGGSFDALQLSVADMSFDFQATFPGFEIYFTPLGDVPILSDLPFIGGLGKKARIPLLGTIFKYYGGNDFFADLITEPHTLPPLRTRDADVPVLVQSDAVGDAGPQPAGCGLQLRPSGGLLVEGSDFSSNGAQLTDPQDLEYNRRHVLTFSPPVAFGGEVHYMPKGMLSIMALLSNPTGRTVTVNCND